MKKTLVIAGMVAAVALLSSCGLKSCYCCEAAGDHAVATETYTDPGRACATLSSSSATCMEQAEAIDCSKVAIGYKKK